MKMTKKQWIVGGAVALVLAGGGAGIVANNQAQAQAEKTAQEAKTAHDNLIKEAKKATEKAETFKAEADVKTAQDAIKKLDEKEKPALIARVEKVRQNWDLVNKADKAVTNAEKVQNDANVKTAQSSIDKIKDEMAKSKKSALQGRLDKVKTAVKNNKERAKAQAAQEQAQLQNDTQAQAADVNNAVAPQAEAPAASGGAVDYGQYAQAPAQNTPSYNPPVTGGNGGGAVAPSTPSGNTGNSDYNNGGGANANPNQSIDDMDNVNHPSNGENSIDGGR
jgi:peptidoglycan DL-endopeptidase CwlO